MREITRERGREREVAASGGPPLQGRMSGAVYRLRKAGGTAEDQVFRPVLGRKTFYFQ